MNWVSLSSSVIQSCPILSHSVEQHSPCPSVSHRILQLCHGHTSVIFYYVQTTGTKLAPSLFSIDHSQHDCLFKWVSSPDLAKVWEPLCGDLGSEWIENIIDQIVYNERVGKLVKHTKVAKGFFLFYVWIFWIAFFKIETYVGFKS